MDGAFAITSKKEKQRIRIILKKKNKPTTIASSAELKKKQKTSRIKAIW